MCFISASSLTDSLSRARYGNQSHAGRAMPLFDEIKAMNERKIGNRTRN